MQVWSIDVGCSPVTVAATTYSGGRSEGGPSTGRSAPSGATDRLFHWLAGHVLGDSQPITIGRREDGKPFLKQHPGIGISASHSAHVLAAAICLDGPVGIDVQHPGDVSPHLCDRCCTPADRLALVNADAHARALAAAETWVVQEALVKLAGTGLSGRPWRIPIGRAHQSGRHEGASWVRLAISGIPAAVAAARQVPADCR
jgi:4'-phosphopantetheinyl transferase